MDAVTVTGDAVTVFVPVVTVVVDGTVLGYMLVLKVEQTRKGQCSRSRRNGLSSGDCWDVQE